jgi:colanic acid biosynthesis glycosyl transferase WcaI
MAHGIPVLASVNPESETARIVRESGGGWVTDAADPAAFAAQTGAVLNEPRTLREAGRAGYAYARANFAPAGVAERFERVLDAVADRPRR